MFGLRAMLVSVVLRFLSPSWLIDLLLCRVSETVRPEVRVAFFYQSLCDDCPMIVSPSVSILAILSPYSFD